MKSLYIAEKPSVAQEFARVLGMNMSRGDGYLEGDNAVVTWCVGHLVTMSYPEAYDPEMKRWRMETLPFLPDEFKYEVIASVKKQFSTVKKLLTRKDIDTIYVCTDSGREGEYIYRLVEQMAGVKGKKRLRVWIDSQTEEEIKRGVREAKDLSEYDNLAASAYLRAKEDYLMGINFSRLLTLKYGSAISGLMKRDRTVISVGRVMTCVLGMCVKREREIRAFVKTPFYRVLAQIPYGAGSGDEQKSISAEFRAVPGSRYENHPALYKENGFKEKEEAEKLISFLTEGGLPPYEMEIAGREKKKEKKNPPLLFNLAELQNVCSRQLKISPDQTLKVVQDLYEKKLVTYPRTDARVLSSAVAKEISKNIKGLLSYQNAAPFAQTILDQGSYKNIAKTRYTNDKQITDHYAIIPTGYGLGALGSVGDLGRAVYDRIVRRFLSIFYPPAEYEKLQLIFTRRGESFFASFKALKDPGYLTVAGIPKKTAGAEQGEGNGENETEADADLLAWLASLKKGGKAAASGFEIKEGETSPPKRYTSGSMILAMENAGSLIEDEELRAQIKGSGIGTSATRAEILKKLAAIDYLKLNKKTQVLTPTFLGEMVFDTVNNSIRSLLNPELTASWEKGLSGVAEGRITEEEYKEKLYSYIIRRTDGVKGKGNTAFLRDSYSYLTQYYKA